MVQLKSYIFLLLLSLSSQLGAQNQIITVFKSGESGYRMFRIPAILKTPDGSLLAFAEGRVNGGSDFGNIDIVMKKSTDEGNSWSDLQIIADAGSLQAGNPAPVVDFSDPEFPKGRIFLFYNTGNNHESEIRKGLGVREIWYKTSVDQGLTWTEPVNITTQVHKPLQPSFDINYSFTADWRSYANTPGHALQIPAGNFAGRIVVAANHSSGNPQPDFSDYCSHIFYSDDHGKSFHLSESLQWPGSNEATAAWIGGDKLILNSRNQKGDTRVRIVARSQNAGQSWDTAYFDKNLPDPVCQGSILNLNSDSKNPILAFVNCADTVKRSKLTLRISFDEGLTWPVKIPVAGYNNEKNNDITAYADITELNNKELGILYEFDNYSLIQFERINWIQNKTE